MNIKLADFGFGNFYVPGEPLSTWCGSPPYAAPEVFEGKQYEGPQLDIWSMGVVLYVLVCGSLPFDGATLPALKKRVTEGRFRVPYFMSQECENLIRRMLAVDPAKRMSVAQIKQHRWMQAYPTAVCQLSSIPHCPKGSLQPESYSEPVLSLMQALGVDKQRTIESLQNNSYNHFSAIYWLLMERLTQHRNQQQIRQSQDWSNEPGYTIPGTEFLGEMEPKLLQYTSSPSPDNLLETRISEKAPNKDFVEECRQLPLNLTTDSRSTVRRHTVSEVSSSKHLCHPPSIVVELVDDGASNGNLRHCSSSSAFSTSLASPGALLGPGTESYVHQIQGLHPLSQNSARGPLTHSSILRFQNSLQVPSFQEGRRASDTSLTQGLRVFHKQLRKSARTKGQSGLNKVKGPVQHVWAPVHYLQGSVSVAPSGSPTHANSWEHLQSLAEGFHDHQRMSHHHLSQQGHQQLLQVPSPLPHSSAAVHQQNTWQSTVPPSTGLVNFFTPPVASPEHQSLHCSSTFHPQPPLNLLCPQQEPPPQYSYCSFANSSSSNLIVDSAALLLETRLQLSPSLQPQL